MLVSHERLSFTISVEIFLDSEKRKGEKEILKSLSSESRFLGRNFNSQLVTVTQSVTL